MTEKYAKVKFELKLDDPSVKTDDIDDEIRKEIGEIKKELQSELKPEDQDKEIFIEPHTSQSFLGVAGTILTGALTIVVAESAAYVLKKTVIDPIVIPRIKRILEKFGVLKIEISDAEQKD